MPSEYPEATARKHIDEQLEQSGWEDLGKGHVWTGTGFVREYPTNSGPVDYALLWKGTPIGVVEAKPPGKQISGAHDQAMRYAKDIQNGFTTETYTVAFTYAADSEGIYFQDLRPKAPIATDLTRFHTPEGLYNRYKNYDYSRSLKRLSESPVKETDPLLWGHQEETVKRIEDALREQKRRALVHMATGSGKTRMAITEVYRLMRNGYANRVLFIPDTRHLVRQAYQDFAAYETPKGPFTDVYSVANTLKHSPREIEEAEVVVATLQKMYTLMEGGDERKLDPTDFDLIVTDECHRLIYENEGYGAVLEMFDAVEIGLTATPSKRTLGRYGDPVFKYDYTQAVKDNHVVPFNIHRIETRITMNGVKDEHGDIRYKPSALGREVFVPDSHRKIAERLREEIDDDELILLFAKNQEHAKRIVRDFKEVYSDKSDDYIKRITSDADRPHETLKAFQRRRDNPKIAVTVDMVTTGVDVKPLKHLVLLTPVKSPVKYNQMMGRGTRKYDGKTEFTIYDCVGALQYFADQGHPPFNTEEFETGGTSGSGDGGDGPGGGSGPELTVVEENDEIIIHDISYGTKDESTISLSEFKRRFEEFIREDRPDDWLEPFKTPDAVTDEEMGEIRGVLHDQPEYYTLDRLRKAYGVSDAGLEDFILTALTGRDAVLTAEHRVEKALSRIQAEMGLGEDEMEWLRLMQKTLEAHGSIDTGHFRFGQLLAKGGYPAACEDFGGEDRLENAIERVESLLTSAETFESD